jgi:hypothetical protein
MIKHQLTNLVLQLWFSYPAVFIQQEITYKTSTQLVSSTDAFYANPLQVSALLLGRPQMVHYFKEHLMNCHAIDLIGHGRTLFNTLLL